MGASTAGLMSPAQVGSSQRALARGIKDIPLTLRAMDRTPIRTRMQEAKIKPPISFSAAGLGGTRTNWDAVLWQERLYVSVSSNQLAEGSKRAFVSLLEYAEEELEVSHVVACLDRLHHDNKNVIRNFLFLGFQPIAPGHEFIPNNPNVVCFPYTI